MDKTGIGADRGCMYHQKFDVFVFFCILTRYFLIFSFFVSFNNHFCFLFQSAFFLSNILVFRVFFFGV